MTGTCTILDHSADIGIECTGGTIAELFDTAAAGMFAILTDTAAVRLRETIEIAAEEPLIEDLLVEWLKELLYVFSVKHFLFGAFSTAITETGDGMYRLAGRCSGEPIDLTRHELYTEIKTVTYHMLTVEKQPAGWLGRVIFDV